MAFLILIISAGFEVAGVTTLNYFSQAQTRQRKALFFFATIALFACALSTLSFAMQDLPLSVAYAVWTGIGAVGSVIVGIMISGDKINAQKAIGLLIVISSAVMLKIM